MGSKYFLEKAKSIVFSYVNEHLDSTDDVEFTEEDIYVVWLSKALQNSKAMMITPIADEMYYEVTYNGAKDEFYLDSYKKIRNRVYKI